MSAHRSGGYRARHVALGICAAIVLVSILAVHAESASALSMRRVVLIGLKTQGNPVRFAGSLSNPASGNYRKFLTRDQYRSRFSANAGVQRKVRRFFARQNGVGKVQLSSSRTTALVVVTPSAAKRIFCAKGSRLPATGLCRPRTLRSSISQVSIGEPFPVGKSKSSSAHAKAATNTGTPEGCQEAVKTGAYTPNQIATAYGVDGLRSRGLDGSGVRIATLSSQIVETDSFKTWGACFGLPTPKVKQFEMPGAVKDTSTDPDETVLDVQALATLAPGLEQITPIFVPLDQGFSNSFLLFMFGALDASRQGGKLPDILSISDGVCEGRFTKAELHLGQRLLAEAAAEGITTLAASGDLGFKGCFTSAKGVMFPSSSRFTTSVGGTGPRSRPGRESPRRSRPASRGA